TGLFIVAMIVYILLQKWYEESYEKYLFKDKKDFYNLVYFIRNAKRRKISDKKIIESLKKSKWSGEKVKYVLNLHAGKKTGLWKPKFWKKK
ncbi:MAG: hypothetical protein U9Q06_02450, partial [Nanoarchaeota archaeon]|nr:hypothetical protein [Nanoarchaeota archaeon]